MEKLSRAILVLLVIVLASFILLGVSTQNGVEIFPDLGVGEVNYFATVGGTGDCTSWKRGCSFRTAVAKCPGTKECTVYVGGGLHDLNNGADATGTTITANYVHIKGMGETGEYGQSSQLMNSHATASHILQVSGSRFLINHVSFDNSNQIDKIITMLTLSGSYTTTMYVGFRQNVGDGGGTAIALTGGTNHTIDYNHFRDINTYGLSIGNVSKVYTNNNMFWKNGIGVYASNANADDIVLRENKYTACTSYAIDLAVAVAKTWHIIAPTFSGNVQNFADVAAYGGTIYLEALNQTSIKRDVYPTSIDPAAGGALVAKDAAINIFGDYNEIVPAATFAKPIMLQGLTLLDWNAAQTYKIELFYGSVNPATVSLGIYDIVLGTPAAGSKVYTPLNLTLYVPARATVGAKIASSTAGADWIRLALDYALL